MNLREPDRSEPHGIVLSDLHLLSWRSRGQTCLAGLQEELRSATVLVLNGDIFDFESTTLPTIDAALEEAYRWFERLAFDHPQLTIHYVFGNHDYVHPFVADMKRRAESWPRLHVHDEFLRLGDRLFLHGDCANRRMSAADLRRIRERNARPRRRSEFVGKLQILRDDSGLTTLMHYLVFWTPRTVARRLTHYLTDLEPGLLDGVRHIYFGHTHLPFRDHVYQELSFHNTGSAVGPMTFHPLRFALPHSIASSPPRIPAGANRPLRGQ